MLWQVCCLGMFPSPLSRAWPPEPDTVKFSELDSILPSPFQVNSFHPASPDGAPGNVAAPSAGFHLQHGVPRSTERERASRISCQVLNAPLERIGRFAGETSETPNL